METINTELILADMQTLEKAIPRLEKELRLDKSKGGRLRPRRKPKEILNQGKTLFSVDLTSNRSVNYFFSPAKPFVYVVNADEAELSNSDFRHEMKELVAPAEVVFLDAKIESELVEMSDEDALGTLAISGPNRVGLKALARVGFDALGLQTYLTAGPKRREPGRFPQCNRP